MIRRLRYAVVWIAYKCGWFYAVDPKVVKHYMDGGWKP